MGDKELTAIMPWYEEEDFTEFSVFCGHSPPDYCTWYRSAMQKVDDLLREGKAVEFVVIRPAAYKAWLADRENTLEMRRRYAEHLATSATHPLPERHIGPQGDARP